jgi:hypothetical protein
VCFPCPCFGYKWAWRSVTTLRLIDRAVDARTDHPSYHNYRYNRVLNLWVLLTLNTGVAG